MAAIRSSPVRSKLASRRSGPTVCSSRSEPSSCVQRAARTRRFGSTHRRGDRHAALASFPHSRITQSPYAVKQLVQAGVRVFFYLEDRERTLDSATDKFMMSLTAFTDELEREKARQRTSDAMQRKAKAGHVTGGRVFGYDNVEVSGPDGHRSHVKRTINLDEAAVVRQIFELAAVGAGATRDRKDTERAGGTITTRAAPTPEGMDVIFSAGSSQARSLPRGDRLQPNEETKPMGREEIASPPPGGLASGSGRRTPYRI